MMIGRGKREEGGVARQQVGRQHFAFLLFLRQYLHLQALLQHRFAAIRGTGVHHQISLLCPLSFARALLEHIVHRTLWLRQVP
jgi:hypothetical protein